MDLSALERAAKALEGSLDSLGFWLFFSTALVVIGLIAEYRHDVIEFWEEVRRPAAMFPWPKFWAIAGGILVTVGVAGELIVGIKASRKESDLRTINHQIEGLLTDKASENDKEAKRLGKEAEQLRKDAEGLQADNLKLEAQIAPRRLDPKQLAKISENCSRFKRLFQGKRVQLVSYMLDTEAFVFSEQIVAALRGCSMPVDDDAMTITPAGNFVFGISVFSSDQELAKKIAEAIGNSGRPIAVGLSGTDPTAGSMKIVFNNRPHAAIILVGLKPLQPDEVRMLKSTIPKANNRR